MCSMYELIMLAALFLPPYNLSSLQPFWRLIKGSAGIIRFHAEGNRDGITTRRFPAG